MSKKIIIGNWKMNPSSLKEAEKLFSNIAKSVSGIKKTEITICAPFVYLEKLKKMSLVHRPTLGRSSMDEPGEAQKISLGAQNVFWGNTGAYTGEVSGEMLYSVGARYVIIGHSERRAMPVRQSLGVGGGETNEMINKKVKTALSSGLRPILCVGENMRDENHDYFNLVKNQLEKCLSGISKNSISKIVIAYEPIWAISSTPDRKNATSDDSREMVIFIRKILSDKFGSEATKMKIIYGGSVNDRDALDFLQNSGVDGLLLGRTSLDSKKFSKIVKICEALNK